MFTIRQIRPNRKLSVIAVVAAIVGLSMSVTVPAAQASAPTKITQAQVHGDRDLLAHPSQVRAAAPAVSPWVSPSVSTTHVTDPLAFSCPSGDLCPAVWDPTTNSWKVFYLFRCARYTVHEWYDYGTVVNNQTGNPAPTGYFYGSGGTSDVEFTVPPTGPNTYWIEYFTPVYSVRNC